jgi:hypothetical protein
LAAQVAAQLTAQIAAQSAALGKKISQLLHKLFWPGPADFRLSFTFVLSITKSFSVELTKNWVSILDLFLSLWHFPDSRRQTGLQAFWEGKKQMQSALTEVRRSD